MMPFKYKYHDITGVILAGGRSSRMGKDKATLKVAGITLFERTLQMMNELFSDVLIAGDRKDLVRAGVPCYSDLYPGSALGGLYTGLLASRYDRIFVCSCDVPFPDVEIARLIVSQPRRYDVVVPKTTQGPEPLFACYRKSCLAPMKDMLERKEFRIYDIYPRVRVRYLGEAELPSDWRWSLMNVNTPEEYNRIKESVGCAPPQFLHL
jgi:molybdopterin-guanine dinucleotide biosynthesis protein A